MIVRVMDVVERHGDRVTRRRGESSSLRVPASPRRRVTHRRLQHLEHTPRRRDTRDPRVETRAQQAQRQIEFGRQDQDKERLLERQSAVEHPQPDLHRDDRRAERADHLQHQRREEGNPQHTQRRIPVALADLGDDRDLFAAAVEQLERRQPLQHVEEVRAHPAEGGPLLPRQAVGQAADEDHEDGDERRGQQQHQAGEGVQRKDDQQKGQRDQHGQRQLRQVLAEVGVQRLDPFDRGVDQFSRALAAGIGRAQRQQMCGQALAQVGFHARGDPAGRQLAGPEQQSPDDGDGCQRDEQRQDVRQREAAQENAVHHAGQHTRGQHDQHAG